MTISAHASVLHANARAKAMLQQASLLQLQHGALAATTPHAQSQWRSMLKHVVNTQEARHLSISPSTPSPAHACYISLMPDASEHAATDLPKLYLCVVSEGSNRRVASVPQIIALFGLSPPEAPLARALAHGHSLEEHAASEGLKRTTMRTHLQHTFNNPGTGTQRDLIPLLLALPALRCP
jgi:DNA-binding CsgD family transcriptional regulator